jgi:hypothetical protein
MLQLREGDEMGVRVLAFVFLAISAAACGPKTCDATKEIDVTLSGAAPSSLDCSRICPTAPDNYTFGPTCSVIDNGPPAKIGCYYRTAPCPG